MEEARKKAVSNWLTYRAQQEAEHGSQNLEERRAKAVENWKSLQKQEAQAKDVGTPARTQNEVQAGEEQAKGGGKDAAEDSDL